MYKKMLKKNTKNICRKKENSSYYVRWNITTASHVRKFVLPAAVKKVSAVNFMEIKKRRRIMFDSF